jgi:hypothetical protein
MRLLKLALSTKQCSPNPTDRQERDKQWEEILAACQRAMPPTGEPDSGIVGDTDRRAS